MKDEIIPEPPKFPEGRSVCDACGDITETGHTSWICRLIIWINKR